jgi:hypothetical protein
MKRTPWSTVLLVVGVVLTLADVILVGVLLFTTPPIWLWSMLSLSPWGPIALVAWVVVARYQRMAHRLRTVGVPARGDVLSIGSTSSQIGGRPVIRLELTIQPPDGIPYPTTVRNAPPAHLIGLLRPGVSLPVRTDPDKPTRVMIDWRTVETENAPH